ncbi:S24 family peptidase [Sphingomonas nostoxanthinifaciens]|uniref:S24 family peptidase n=1 Tax=Sphingomonas nostoxanthinifaciens TaxID=2872652 RepID=UPI001CC21618|nr:S24 family peptidase [Sphingomonas nostoxanthinifaciens]UAK24371.1 hypothetical protein K8P63_18995 [Sphingomonas nostoxanthinifaciens]
MKVDPRDIATRAAELAIQRRLTEREASIDASGKPDLIRDMRRGRMPSSDRLSALAATLGTTVDFLMGTTTSSLPANGADTTPDLERLPLDVPVYGTALGADLSVRDGEEVFEIEQTIIELTEIIDRVRRLPGIAGDKDAYSLTVVGNSMSPRYDDGDPIYISTRRQAAIGDYVVVQVKNGASDEVVSALVKKLVGRSSTHLELEQFNPPLRFRLERNRVARIHRVLTPRELAGR